MSPRRSALFLAVATAGCRNEYATECISTPEPEESFACTGVCINEVGAKNEYFLTDLADTGVGAREDWVELYNNGTQTVDLDGLELERHDSGTASAALPPYLLEPRDCVLFVASFEHRDDFTLDFDLNADFGTLRLWGPDRCLIDRVHYPRQFAERSWGRSPDGGAWRALDRQSPCGHEPAVVGEGPPEQRDSRRRERP